MLLHHLACQVVVVHSPRCLVDLQFQFWLTCDVFVVVLLAEGVHRRAAMHGWLSSLVLPNVSGVVVLARSVYTASILSLGGRIVATLLMDDVDGLVLVVVQVVILEVSDLIEIIFSAYKIVLIHGVISLTESSVSAMALMTTSHG